MPKSYGTPIDPERRVGPPANRNRVGEADPATRRRMLDQRLREREPTHPRAERSQPSASQPAGISPNAARLLRDRGRQIDSEVKKRS